MAQIKDLIVSGVTRCIGRLFAADIVGDLTGTASNAIADNRNQTIDSTYIKGISSSDGVTITYTKGDGTTASFDVRGTEYSTATDSQEGLVKLYSSSGNNTDGTITQAGITTLLSQLHTFEIQVVDELPNAGTSHTLYFVPYSNGDADTMYEEYVWITTTDEESGESTSYFEKVGMTTADLGSYYTSSQVDSLLSDKLDKTTVATDTVSGITKLYDTTGSNTDGTMSQAAIGSAINAVYNSPTFTGTPTAPTVADSSDNTDKIATTAFVQLAVQAAIEAMIENGYYVAKAGTADGEELGTADLEPLTFMIGVPTN